MVYNFSAGPAVLYDEVLNQIQKNIVNYQGIEYSLLEESHRSKIYDDVHVQTIHLLAELLGINLDTYAVMLLGGGATLQFAMLAYNFLHKDKNAHYIITGVWGKKSFNDAKKIGNAKIIYDGADISYHSIPQNIQQDEKQWDTNNNVYTHMVTNETIGGLQWNNPPYPTNIPIKHLVADMSSDILSRPIDINKYSFIYAGVQKNIGPAGLTLVIAKKEFLHTANKNLPSYLSYNTHADNNSLYNTPPVFSIWATNLTLQHIKTIGGLHAVEKINTEKATLLYSYIDSSDGFYTNPIDIACRSKMNVVFKLATEELETLFVSEATKNGLLCLKGHRSVGGCRASIYNAMPIKGVQTLVDFMIHFRKTQS